MKDQDIVNALRACSRTNCSACPQNGKYRWLDIRCITDIERQAADVIEAQTKEIDRLRAQLPRWIPVEERLPEYGVRVLATDMYEGDDYTGIRTREEYPDDTDGCWYDELGRWYPIDDATHWMPLPKVPEVERSKQ